MLRFFPMVINMTNALMRQLHQSVWSKSHEVVDSHIPPCYAILLSIAPTFKLLTFGTFTVLSNHVAGSRPRE